MIRHYLKVDIWLARSILSWGLLILALLLMPVAVVFLWLKITIFDTEHFVKTLGPVSQSPVIIEALSARIGDQFFQNIEVESKIREALPENSKFLAPTFTFQLEKFIAEEGKIVLTSDAFHSLWEKVLRGAQPVLIQLLTGQGGVQVNNQGEVVLDFSEAITQIKNVLNNKGTYIFNDYSIDPQIVLFKSAQLANLQHIFKLISVWGIVLPVVVLLLVAGAILAAVKRRQFLIWVGLGTILAMMVLFLLINLGEDYFLKMAASLGVEAAVALYQIITSSLKNFLAGILIIGIITTGCAKFLQGKS